MFLGRSGMARSGVARSGPGVVERSQELSWACLERCPEPDLALGAQLGPGIATASIRGARHRQPRSPAGQRPRHGDRPGHPSYRKPTASVDSYRQPPQDRVEPTRQRPNRSGWNTSNGMISQTIWSKPQGSIPKVAVSGLVNRSLTSSHRETRLA